MNSNILNQGWLLRLVAMTTLVWSAQLVLSGFKPSGEIEFSGHGKFLFATISKSDAPGSHRAFRQSSKADPLTLIASQNPGLCSVDGLQYQAFATAGLIQLQATVLPLIRAPPQPFSA